MWIWCDLRSSLIPVDENDFGAVMHPRKQYFQNIQDKIGGPLPPVEGDSLLAIYPAIGDIDYTRYKFYQVNKGEFATPETNFIWEISDSVGPGVLQEASGLDIRPYLSSPRELSAARDNLNTFDPEMTTNVFQLSADELHLFGWQFGNPIHEWILSAPHVFPATGAASDFQFSPTETNGRDIKFLDNGKKMAIVGTDDNTIELYSLPTPFSFSTTPVLLQTFDLNFIPIDTQSCDFSADGMQLYVINETTDEINQWNLVTANTLPAASTAPDKIFLFNPPSTSLGNCRMFQDGSAFYLMNFAPRQISQYDTDGFNQIPIVNESPDSFFDLNAFDNNLRAMSVSVDGSFIWFSGRQFNTLFELFLPGRLLVYEVTSVNVTTGDFTIKVSVPSIQDFTFIQIAFGNPSAIDNSLSLGAGNTLSTFDTPLLTKDEDNFLVDNQGRNIVAVQS